VAQNILNAHTSSLRSGRRIIDAYCEIGSTKWKPLNVIHYEKVKGSLDKEMLKAVIAKNGLSS